MRILKLKNGSEEALPLVIVVMRTLTTMMENGMDCIAVYELVEKCKDDKHMLFGNAEEKLKALALIEQSGHIHDSVRNIVLSAAEGEGLNMGIGNPVACTKP